MAHEFRRRADQLLMCRLEGEEKAIIAQVAQEVSDLLRQDLGLAEESPAVRRAADSDDPLERLEAEFAAREARSPRDSAVQRLLPDASEDPQIAAEFRRLGQSALVSEKLECLGSVMSAIDTSGSGAGEVVLDEESAIAWARALTDMRLVLADRLGVQRDGDFETLQMLQDIGERVQEDTAHERPAAQTEDGAATPDVVAAIYELLSWLQESLVRALSA